MPERRTSGKLPPPDYYDGDPTLEVFSWCPTPTPTVKPTQVHLHVPIASEGKVIVRFKGSASLDALIAALQEHRRDVFGEPDCPECYDCGRPDGPAQLTRCGHEGCKRCERSLREEYGGRA